MKRGNKLLDGPGTPSLMSVQELRLMALLRTWWETWDRGRLRTCWG